MDHPIEPPSHPTVELDAKQIDEGHAASEPDDIAGEVESKRLPGSALEGIHDIAGGSDALANCHRRQSRIRPPLTPVDDGCAVPDDVDLRELGDIEKLIDYDASLRALRSGK